MARGASVVDLQLLPAAVGRGPGSKPEYPAKGECGGAPWDEGGEEAGDLPALALPRSWTRSTRCFRTCRFPGECTVQLLPEPNFRQVFGRWVGTDEASASTDPIFVFKAGPGSLGAGKEEVSSPKGPMSPGWRFERE